MRWVVAGLLLIFALACATIMRPARPLCGPLHPEYLGGCDVLAERRWRHRD